MLCQAGACYEIVRLAEGTYRMVENLAANLPFWRVKMAIRPLARDPLKTTRTTVKFLPLIWVRTPQDVETRSKLLP